MTSESAQTNGEGSWTFVCDICGFTSEEASEVEALNSVDKHCDYGPGHFDFTITGPDGEVQYP